MAHGKCQAYPGRRQAADDEHASGTTVGKATQ